MQFGLFFDSGLLKELLVSLKLKKASIFNERWKTIENDICFVRWRKLEKLEKFPTLLISDYRNISSKGTDKLKYKIKKIDLYFECF